MGCQMCSQEGNLNFDLNLAFPPSHTQSMISYEDTTPPAREVTFIERQITAHIMNAQSKYYENIKVNYEEPIEEAEINVQDSSYQEPEQELPMDDIENNEKEEKEENINLESMENKDNLDNIGGNDSFSSSDIVEEEDEVNNLSDEEARAPIRFSTTKLRTKTTTYYGPKRAFTIEPQYNTDEKTNQGINRCTTTLREKIKVDCSIFKHEHKGIITNFYEILAPIGKGSFASVYKIRHLITSDIRAVKVIAKKLMVPGIDPASEFEILKNLDHPNILRLYEYFQDEKNYYLISEFCNGGELFEEILKLKHFSERKAARIMQQLLSVVAYCHDHSVIHRDLKPENLILEHSTQDAPIKVIDFGGSKIFSKSEQSKIHESFGTPYYIAPEVLKKNHDEKCDLWSCGVILYALLWGKPPFNAKSHNSILKTVMLGNYSLQDPEATEISKGAKYLVSRMLEYDPIKRITAKEALEDEWILNNTAMIDGVYTEVALKTFNNLRNFAAKQKLSEAVLSYLVTQMESKEEETRLRGIFQAFDANKDGQLSKDELVNGYTIIFGDPQMATVQVERIMDHVDMNHNGLLDYSEFIIANANYNQFLGDKQLKVAFEQFDLDGNGEITVNELEEVMGAGLETNNADKFFSELVAEVDINGDGQINFDEFKVMMMHFQQRRFSLN